MPCIVPTRTAPLLDLADSETVGMPPALSAAAASFTIQLERAAMPIACDSMPSSRQVVTCRTSASSSASRVRTATILGRRPCSRDQQLVYLIFSRQCLTADDH
jgi:hypothetical protein